MTRIDDKKLWYEAYLDTPFRTGANNTRSRVEAGRLPGNAVKARLRQPGQTFPTTGVLVTYDKVADATLVRAHADMDEHWIWRGTIAEYDAIWEVD